MSNEKSPPEKPLADKKEKFDWEWYDPPQDSAFVDYCNDSSLHGIQYMGQEGRHMLERIFWFAACLAAGIYGGVFIFRMWNEYLEMPIEIVFNTREKTLAEIPFPSVTICNVNNIRRSRAEEYKTNALNYFSGGTNQDKEAYLKTLASINDVRHICESKKTFAEQFTPDIPRFTNAPEIEEEIEKNKEFVKLYENPTKTLRKGSQPCHEMILFCLWLDEPRNCSEIFQEVEIDYGVCCTFNLIPMSLLRKFKYQGDVKDNPLRVKEWEMADLSYDNLILGDESPSDRKYPLRQLYPGRAAGLSLLLDPDLNEYDCTNTDSEGFLTNLKAPLDVPRMRDGSGIALPAKSEIFISMRPEVTMSDESVHGYALEKRRCYFDGEHVLPHYTKYTLSNCMDECVAQKTFQLCQCKLHYMPRGNNETLCSSPQQHRCTDSVRKKIIQVGLSKECNYCLPTCTEVEYHAETTMLPLREKTKENLKRQYPTLKSFGNVSIVHVYFSVDAVYPRLRQETTSAIDLLADAGGLLGFTQGFSILSVLEVLWYLTFRIFFQMYRNKWEGLKGKGSVWKKIRTNYKKVICIAVILVGIIVATYYLRNVIVGAATVSK